MVPMTSWSHQLTLFFPPTQVPSFFGSAKLIVNLAQHTAFDAQLVQRLALKLQVRASSVIHGTK